MYDLVLVSHPPCIRMHQLLEALQQVDRPLVLQCLYLHFNQTTMKNNRFRHCIGCKQNVFVKKTYFALANGWHGLRQCLLAMLPVFYVLAMKCHAILRPDRVLERHIY